MPRLTINKQPVEVEDGASLLAAIEKMGVKVPTLCHHRALSPYGACRLCVVEVQAPERPPTLQASCSYPVQEGISVFTDTERVNRARKIVAELLLARCPESETIRGIAAGLGVDEPRIEKKYDDCIYCGLCERMCRERMGREAIGFSGRGPRRQLEPPFGQHNPMCWACGACDFICPVGKKVSPLATAKELVAIPNPHNLGLDNRPAIHTLYPQAIPNVPSIDRERCVHLSHGVCRVCEEVCEADAINFQQEEETIRLPVGAVVLAPGVDLFDPRIKEELGYGVYPNVITSLEFERILSASGPYSGVVLRPSDKTVPKRIAFIQCVGSRDAQRDFCSAVCCMYATKEAIIAKEHVGDDLECDILLMDARAFSKGFEEYYQRAQGLGVNYIRCRPAAVKEMPDTRNLQIEYLTDGDQKATQEYDLVILSVGMCAPKNADDIALKTGISLNDFKFGQTSTFGPVDSGREGIYLAGSFVEPKDIPETVMQGSAAASKVLSILKDERFSLTAKKEYPPETDVSEKEARVGVFVCHCGANIASVVNVPGVVEYARTLPDVVYAENYLYACSSDAQELMKERIKQHDLTRVVVASCTPRTHEPLFRDTVREGGLNRYLFEMANIRDHCSWVHRAFPNEATEKAKDLVRMAVAKARLLEPLQRRSVAVTKSALVIGGGLAGMTCANELADMGFDVNLVEQQKELGGHVRRVRYLIGGEDPQEQLKKIVDRTSAHKKIRLFTEATVESVQGSVGDFTTTISSNGDKTEVTHGVVVVATGAREYRPTEYLYDEDERVVTQLQLEERLARDGDWLTVTKGERPKTVVMIQCVGSRDEERPYCSRICCTQAIKNALTIKEHSPETNVYILYRDVRVYGFKERFYTQARRKNVAFVRYHEQAKPLVSRNGNTLTVEVLDQTLKMPIEIAADCVVLSTGIVAKEEDAATSWLLKVPLDSTGFFLEAHMKLRPVDFATGGVFLCGLAHSAKSVEESVGQAQAAAGRAAAILSNDTLELEATISEVIDENCDGCAYCIEPCPADAITLIEYMSKGEVKKMVEVNPTACLGCGCCQATCPKKGISIRGFTLSQLSAQVEAALEQA
jgi:heterodisulfide reductase subunit A